MPGADSWIFPFRRDHGRRLSGGPEAWDAARFSFLTATPVILGATVLEAPKLLHHHSSLGSVAILAGVVAGVVAFVSVWALMRWFRAHEEKGGFTPFAIYCVLAGAGALAWMTFG